MSFLSQNQSVEGQTALITGGTKNLGAHTAAELAKYGANLFLHYHSNKEEAEKFQAQIKSEFPKVKVELYQGNLANADDLAKLFEAGKKAFPSGIDIAINNVGKVLKKPITKISEEEFDDLNTLNNKVAFFFIKEAGKNLNQNGRIVSLVTSLLAAYTPFYGLYQGTKAGVEYYVKAASKELAEKRITVNAVAPGPMDTPFLYGQETDDDIKYFKSVGLDGRLTKVEDIVPIVRFLATEGTWITGQTIYASGGFTAH
ncbi:NAD(P)-binding protein [Suhomyces tanzawaensis NRRL Y-17324]|uniref:NAD(P)-binding protein n=1 Tax=Suhomyces tanzawaensis NRRL Y-17324 TaxID=984487 RepID=A0A1E4SG55_9ASCO|nr:NAD(P)-binding protein [Suhomyces tanzawaensis NRRL Y-17324]ODV78450.1 NAD(P)-binding protein [Suhomyces tanzawaensis NRRL Y-17324]